MHCEKPFNLPELTVTHGFSDNVQAYHKLSINKVMIRFIAHTASWISSSHRYKS